MLCAFFFGHVGQLPFLPSATPFVLGALYALVLPANLVGTCAQLAELGGAGRPFRALQNKAVQAVLNLLFRKSPQARSPHVPRVDLIPELTRPLVAEQAGHQQPDLLDDFPV